MPSQKEREGGTEPMAFNVIPMVRWLWRASLPKLRRWRPKRPKEKKR
jgi:hypothetical protein